MRIQGIPGRLVQAAWNRGYIASYNYKVVQIKLTFINLGINYVTVRISSSGGKIGEEGERERGGGYYNQNRHSLLLHVALLEDDWSSPIVLPQIYPLFLFSTCIVSICFIDRYGPQFQTSIPSYMELPEYITNRHQQPNKRCGDRKWAWPQQFSRYRARFLFKLPHLKSWMKP